MQTAILRYPCQLLIKSTMKALCGREHRGQVAWLPPVLVSWSDTPPDKYSESSLLPGFLSSDTSEGKEHFSLLIHTYGACHVAYRLALQGRPTVEKMWCFWGTMWVYTEVTFETFPSELGLETFKKEMTAAKGYKYSLPVAFWGWKISKHSCLL